MVTVVERFAEAYSSFSQGLVRLGAVQRGTDENSPALQFDAVGRRGPAGPTEEWAEYFCRPYRDLVRSRR